MQLLIEDSIDDCLEEKLPVPRPQPRQPTLDEHFVAMREIEIDVQGNFGDVS